VRQLLVWVVVLVAGQASAQQPDTGKRLNLERVVAVVNESVILRSELDARLVPVLSMTAPIARQQRIAKTLDEMINEELIVQAAEAAKIQVDSSEIQAALDEIKQQNNLDDAGLAQALAMQGYTLQAYKLDLRRQMLRLRAINQLVGPKVQVTDEDVRARYDQLQRRSATVEAVFLSHILIRLPAHPTEQQMVQANEKVAKAIEETKMTPFAVVAQRISASPDIVLGWFQRGSLDPAFEQIVFSMQKGEVRGPVPGPDGLHVIRVDDIKQSALKPFPEMKEKLERELKRAELEKQVETWVEELRKKAYVDIKLQ